MLAVLHFATHEQETNFRIYSTYLSYLFFAYLSYLFWGVPYLFVRTSGPNMNRYFANVPVRRNITKGTKVKVISIEREPNGNIISRKLDVTKGEKVQNGYNKKVLLNSRNVVQAAKEARKLVEENEKVVPKRKSGFTKEHHQNTN